MELLTINFHAKSQSRHFIFKFFATLRLCMKIYNYKGEKVEMYKSQLIRYLTIDVNFFIEQ